MTRFLHVSDIHLGTNQYNSPNNTRKKDFFFAFKDVIDKYAIAEKVDFVLLTGDLFDRSRIDPNTLNQAMLVFDALKKNNIPVFAIEGNHDCHWDKDVVSWIQFLGEHGYINFLKPTFDKDNNIVFSPYKNHNQPGAVFDFNDQVRVVGLPWMGSNTSNMISSITEGIKSLKKHPYTILLMHAGIEGYLAGYGAISKAQIELLRPYVNYLALGHIHKFYIHEGWAVSPGSLEACCIPEFFDPHGAVLVDINEDNTFKYSLKENYFRREFIRLGVDISSCNTAEDAINAIKKKIIEKSDKNYDQPVVEVLIDGVLNFRRNDLPLDEIKQQVKEMFDALLVNIKYYARSKEYAVGANLSVKSNREDIEKTVVRDMLAVHGEYKSDLKTYTDTVLMLKNMVLDMEPNDIILKSLEDKILEKKKVNVNQ